MIMRNDDETTPRLIEAPASQPTHGNDSRHDEPDSAAVTLAAFATSTPDSANPPRITDDDIRLRAFEIYCSRDDADGDALTDWLTAEREIRVARALGGNLDANAPNN